ncbi:MAG: molybdenum cofactor guanylyltransferase [Acidimicrobiales bacterium]
MTGPSRSTAAILLCGGASRRMGWDKTRLTVDGATVPARTAALLTRVVAVAVEVGPGRSGLPATREDRPGDGPLAGVVAGWEVLCASPVTGALVIAGDLPFLSEQLLRFLVDWESPNSVVPVVEGRDQPLCARWARRDLDEARRLWAEGERSLRHLAKRSDVDYVDESGWSGIATSKEFADVDTLEDVRRWGLHVAEDDPDSP